MFLLISFDVFTPQDVLHFNTSHVSINLIRESRMVGAHGISIHLMFLLIGNGDGKLKSWDIDFNTSHVSINQKAHKSRLSAFLISIHLMFLLIKLRWTTIMTEGFQYISCFY